MLRKIGLLITIAAIGVIGVTSTAAQGETITIDSEEYGSIALFTDGRVNNADIDAPVIIYYTSETVPVRDEQGEFVWGKDGIFYQNIYTGIELLTVKADGAAELVLYASADDIRTAQAADLSQIVGAYGYSLNFGENGWFWVSGPANSEGKVYTFSWDDGSRILTASE